MSGLLPPSRTINIANLTSARRSRDIASLFLLSSSSFCHAHRYVRPFRTENGGNGLSSPSSDIRGPSCDVNKNLWSNGTSPQRRTRKERAQHSQLVSGRDASVSADDALNECQKGLPSSAILKLLRKPTLSRKTFYQKLCIYRKAIGHMDVSSRFYSISLLIESAISIHADLLRLLQSDIKALPRSFSANHFNHLLRLISEARTYHRSELENTQFVIVMELRERQLSINRRGYRAMLRGARDNLEQVIAVEQEMTRAGYSLNRKDRHNLDRLYADSAGASIVNLKTAVQAVKSAKSIKECLRYFDTSVHSLRPEMRWGIILEHYHHPAEALQDCLDLTRAHTLDLDERLTLSLFRASKGKCGRAELDSVVQLALAQGVFINVDIWTEYLKKLIWTGQRVEVVSILTNEPGGNFLLDMSPMIRRDPRVWVIAMLGLHGLVRGNQLEPAKHARSMELLITAMQKFNVPMTGLLVWCLVEGAIYSGPRDWARVHTCDVVVKLFKEEVNLGDEPWKVPCNDQLWTSYMTVLVLNEETVLLQEAMTNMLQNTRPTNSILKLFALGLLESGSLETVVHWKTYFENELQMEWPSQEAAFAMRNTPRLQYFYQ